MIKMSRYTPTCVGKTLSHANSCSRLAVHPHMRGENQQCGTAGRSLAGTPPHAWGKPFDFILNSLFCVVTKRSKTFFVGSHFLVI